MSNSIVQEILTPFSRRTAPWEDVQTALQDALVSRPVYLGGDGLRPYACWTDGASVHIHGVQPASLPEPPLVQEILRGDHGLPVRTQEEAGRYSVRLPLSTSLADRLDVPRLLLVGLGDAERYRGARLPLGIARLSQWLRFTHCARVTVVDYNMVDEPLRHVEDLLDREQFDIVGVSVNFGQWHMLEDLAQLVNKHQPRLVALGNILAAFSPNRAASLFDAARDGAAFVATSLGERPLERLCREFRNPSAWPGIEGLIRPGEAPAPLTSVPQRVEPPELVYPDDSLVLEIAARGGQIALETSFGCQYGACTFCPRDHRGDGWERGHDATVVATLERVAPLGAVLSVVDEEFFGTEGLIDPPTERLPAATILAACRRLGVSYEIYTRLEQIFDRRRSREWNLARAQLLAREAQHMRRIFVGVESGSPSQLRRYGKGQTVVQTEDALRIGSSLGIPMEFGFITFDPLLTPQELAENLAFLARRDVMTAPVTGGTAAQLAAVTDYLDQRHVVPSGVPLFQHVAYMATELEVLAHSRYADSLRRRHPDLLDGAYDPSFARYGVHYRDPRIGELAGWCRVWTEGMFTPVYEARMTARASEDPSSAEVAVDLVARYRTATFSLLASMTAQLLPELKEPLGPLFDEYAMPSCENPREWLDHLAQQTLPEQPPVAFDLELRDQRRQR
ncbi:B12-binding domain-containing radical SAM protein [Streptomyces sp. NPDC091972]|uniref:B12-binding domain-containing radical SAM protein n=1 Tax=Streptomyces sp. NPDC091972 TaxID=3366007 RepID=UPI003822D496